MKKVLLFVAAAALVSGTMVSCGKSSKGKMDGEWNVDSMTMTNTQTSGGSTDTEVTSIDGATITQTSTSGGSSNSTTGTVNTATWTIKKDGTFERVISITFAGTGYSNSNTTTSTGNWDFAAGVGEFKKNERVIFSTTSETSSNSTTVGSSTTTSTSSNSYLDGENSEIFVITESKGKSLSMESKGSNTYTSGSNSNTETNETVVTMSL